MQAEGSDAPQVFNNASSQLSSPGFTNETQPASNVVEYDIQMRAELEHAQALERELRALHAQAFGSGGSSTGGSIVGWSPESKDTHLQPAVTLPRTVALSDTAQVRVWCLQCDACILIFKIRPSRRL